MVTEQKELWDSFGGIGIASEYAKYAEKAKTDVNGNEIDQTYATKAVMAGATEQASGNAGLVPAPLIADKDKYLKGDGTWSTINEVPSSTSSDSGKVLKVNQSGSAEWAEVGSGLPDPTESDSLLLGQSDGSKEWNALSRDVMGTPLLDESNIPILDENSNPVYDANSTTDLWTSFAGHEFGAKRAYADQEGNNIKATYARKEVLDDLASALDTINDKLESVSHGGMYDLGDKTESDLDNGKLAIGCGNSTTTLTLTTVNAVTILANNGVPNFALLIDNSGNSNAVIVTVKDSTDTTTFLQSVSAGNEVAAGKIYQLTCVGKCWTLSEFETANA